jgi:predicted DCC family thiol-disulfide oxidoreductase YuxK
MSAPPRASLPEGALVVLYDGVCGFCNAVVQFLLPRDRQGRIWFAPLQSPLAAEVLARHGRTPTSDDTMYLISGLGRPEERLAWKSEAALTVAAALGYPWRLARVLRVVPRGLRDWGYDVLARVRYRLFGRHESCPIPPPAWRQRFLDH